MPGNSTAGSNNDANVWRLASALSGTKSIVVDMS
jgi:hypothetical protein